MPDIPFRKQIHSVTFGDKNTWEDWHLVPSSRPLFSTPGQKVQYVDVPGHDGFLEDTNRVPVDFVETITGYPIYENRTGSIEFYVMNGYGPWTDRYSEIANYLHGHAMRAYLDDESVVLPDGTVTYEYFYVGRFNVNEWRSEKDYSKIVIDYTVGPYKWYYLATTEPWKWDPFNFRTGVISNGIYVDPETGISYEGAGAFIEIPIPSGGTELEFPSAATGVAPQEVGFVVNSGNGITVTVTSGSESASLSILSEDPVALPGLVLYQGKWLYDGIEATVSVAPIGSSPVTISLAFQKGVL